VQTRKRVPRGLSFLAGSFLPHEAEVPAPQQPAASSGLIEKIQQEVYPPAPPEPKETCPHGRPMVLVDRWSRSLYDYILRAYYDSEGNWVSVQPGEALTQSPGEYVVAEDCPACCPYCPHEISKPRKKRRKMILQDIATGRRIDSKCAVCNPEGIQTLQDWNAYLEIIGLPPWAGFNAFIERTGGGSKALEEKDARHSKHADHGKPAKKTTPAGAGSEFTSKDDLGLLPGMGSGNRQDSTGILTRIENEKAVEKNTKDDFGEGELEVVQSCSRQRHLRLLEKAGLTKFQSLICPACSKEIFPLK
jgi:hypothetical protein